MQTDGYAWISAAQTNDSDYVWSNMRSKVGFREPRSTDLAHRVVHGFTAMLYACYLGCHRVSQVLVSEEILMLTTDPLELTAVPSGV